MFYHFWQFVFEIVPASAAVNFFRCKLNVCKKCAEGITGKDEVEELRDIAAVLKITAGTDKNIKTSMEALLRIADRLERERTK